MHSLVTPLPLSVANKVCILLVQVCIVLLHRCLLLFPAMHVKGELGEQRDRIQEIIQLCALYTTLIQ